MPPWWGMRVQPNPTALIAPFLCICGCHGGPTTIRPKAVKDRVCEECWEDRGKTLEELLSL